MGTDRRLIAGQDGFRCRRYRKHEWIEHGDTRTCVACGRVEEISDTLTLKRYREAFRMSLAGTLVLVGVVGVLFWGWIIQLLWSATRVGRFVNDCWTMQEMEFGWGVIALYVLGMGLGGGIVGGVAKAAITGIVRTEEEWRWVQRQKKAMDRKDEERRHTMLAGRVKAETIERIKRANRAGSNVCRFR